MEDSQTKTTEQDNEGLISEMLRDVRVVEPPEPIVISKGDETMPAPTILREISSAGHVYVWDTRTYEKLPVLYYLLGKKLRARRKDGSYRFTTKDPGREPVRGKLKCLLHKDDPNRAHYDEMGFRVCTREFIPNLHQQKMHMTHKHKNEWAAIEEERKDKERQEDRALQRMVLESIPKAKEPAPLYVSNKPAKKKK